MRADKLSDSHNHSDNPPKFSQILKIVINLLRKILPRPEVEPGSLAFRACIYALLYSNRFNFCTATLKGLPSKSKQIYSFLTQLKLQTYTIVTSKFRKTDLKREGSRKDGMWKDGQTLVSQVSGQKQIPRVESILFIARFGI